MSPILRLLRVQPFDPDSRYQTSWLLSPFILAVYRLVIASYIFAALIYNLVWGSLNNPQRVQRHWSYFTNITYWSLGFYFLFAGVHGMIYASKGYAPLKRWPKLLQVAHGVLYSTVITFPFLVTVVYWVILAPDESPFTSRFNTWSNISVHAMNSIWAFSEIVIPSTEQPSWGYLPFLIIFLALYLALAYVTHATQGFYTYGFLDPNNGSATLCAYVFGIMAAIIVLFIAVWLLIWLRKWVCESVFNMPGKTYNSKNSREEST
ncbi:hypothetical protein EDC01DRAFT_15741 [Geopyxis carbonaria]|nr:hypothetical protein EDC01DRAFT_15741 [Geopyxis carbonaria]